MASVCFYFQVHQPFRLRHARPGAGDPHGFDDEANRVILEKVAEKCYRPATRLLLELVRRHEGRFRLSYSITGTVLEQLRLWAPDVVDLFRELVDTGCCELLAETSHHSLAYLFSKDEFDAQVDLQERMMQETFGRTPTIFRNTELTYDNGVADHVLGRGRHRAIVCEGVDRVLAFRSPNYVYVPPAPYGSTHAMSRAPVKLLLKKYTLSDDIAFRFSNREWEGWPLTAPRFAEWVHQINGDGYLCNLFMDYETLGEHQWAETGIFEFLAHLPEAILTVGDGSNDFVTPSEAIERYEPVGVYDAPETTSWADTERDLTAWLGNGMQRHAARALYDLEAPVKERAAAGDDEVLEIWRKLTTSDHVYYMSTKFWGDGDVHTYFSPYDSPYAAYATFMDALDHLRDRVGVSFVPGG